jgi:hypothetical protein
VLTELLEQIGATRLLAAIQRTTERLGRVFGSSRAGTVAFWLLVTSPATATLAWIVATR